MAYRIQADEPVQKSIKRVVAEELASAIEQLSKREDREKSVHEARKSIKKVRGALRLVQPALGETYRAENEQLRDVGRSLSEFRDQVAMIEVFDELAKWREGRKGRHKDVAEEFASIRESLEKRKSVQEHSAKIVKVANDGVQVLRAAGERLASAEFSGDGMEAVAAGLEKRYRRGRKAMKTAEKDPVPEQYHAWRKRVKDQWYHVRLLGEVSSKSLDRREEKLKELETCLGDDHNLVVLSERLEQHPAQFGKAETIKAFLKLTREYQQDLRDRAGVLGRSLYKRKAARFAQKVRKAWRGEWTKHQHPSAPEGTARKLSRAGQRRSHALAVA